MNISMFDVENVVTTGSDITPEPKDPMSAMDKLNAANNNLADVTNKITVTF